MPTYYERLDNLFAVYAPEKRPLVAGILQKYSGREEEVLQSLVRKFGPEPSEALNHTKGGNSYRERLVCFYTKYAPGKLVTVDATLARCAGREEELFSALVEKYGPEPAISCGDEDSRSVEKISDTQSDLSRTTSSMSLVPYNVHDFRWRLARILMEHAPGKLAILDQMMEKYAGREEEMLAGCVARYGPEPLPPDIQSPRSRLLRFIEHYVPRKASSVDVMLKKYDGRTEALFAALVHKLGPEPPAPSPGNELSKPTYRQRLIRFYEFYARERLADVDTILRRYNGDEESMFRILVERYGPEPDPAFDSDAPIEPATDYHTRLTRLFTKYAPERVDSVPYLLAKYKGSESNIIKALIKKLGPEPPFDASGTQSAMVHLGNVNEGPGNGVPPGTSEFRDDDGKEGSEVHSKAEKPEEWLRHLSLPLSAYRRYAVNRLGEARVSALEILFGIPCLLFNENGGDEKDEKRWVIVKAGMASGKKFDAAQESEELKEPMIAECISANFACLVLILETVKFPLPAVYDEGKVFSLYPFCTLLGDRDRFTLRICAAIMDLRKRVEAEVASLLHEEEVCRGLIQRMDGWKQQHIIRLKAKEAYKERLVQKSIELLPEFEEKERQDIITVEQIEIKGKAFWFYEGLQTPMNTCEDLQVPYGRQRLGNEKKMSVGGKHVGSPPPPAGCRGFSQLIFSHLLRGQNRENYGLRSLQSYKSSAEDTMDVSLVGGQKMGSPATVTTPVSWGPKHSTQEENSPCNLLEASPPPRKPRGAVEPTVRVLRFSGERIRVNGQVTPAGNKVDITGRDKWGPSKDGRISQIAAVPCRDTREAILLGEDPGKFCKSGNNWLV
ncbi:hypothetical protein C3747_25g77 [Trypanosoma cruzi]|uniref:Uncharacterized protein n=2 Tax=Trypanosoma cruzi TaxID=5693 RepID=Q4DFZ3_TRYCC|nr:hypothetical protein Tc00.1047053508027.100 [Trypanosoma cruzi]EAN91449.1 hypothetical protein Tc00.1047053508027.100 [Trypanosoma cruzi]PWV16055.1 hypothetical protein C3747_25g77 [Trypanosoma cruzi]RNC44550.1 hypothetical protein TcCL_NonESM05739 [Trypanosoma cruzi]|eukprot:XP_813300.1 hypothetical protein [Trypanosoma cruzi strain CL Brener]